jgi:hypothetical protein
MFLIPSCKLKIVRKGKHMQVFYIYIYIYMYILYKIQTIKLASRRRVRGMMVWCDVTQMLYISLCVCVCVLYLYKILTYHPFF